MPGKLPLSIFSFVKPKQSFLLFRPVKKSLSLFCCALFKNQQRKETVQCAECNTDVTVFRKKGSLTCLRPIDHARFHLGKIIFTCRQCGHGTSSQNAIRNHVINKHGLNSSDVHYKDESGIYVNEIIAMLGRCFGPPADDRGYVSANNKDQLTISRKR